MNALIVYIEFSISRLVSICSKELKDAVGEKLNKTVQEMAGIENFTDMICDETIAMDSEAVCAFLEEKGHPALGLEPMM